MSLLVATRSPEALAERAFLAQVAAFELASIHLGHRLGLYAALDGLGSATSAELAGAASVDERYAREWLEQQAAADLLACENAARPPADRRFTIPDAHRGPLLDPEHPAAVAGLARMAVGFLAPIDHVIRAFRTGDGVPYEAYGEDAREGIAEANRPMFTNDMASWIAAAPEVQARLTAGGARVADLGCGCGWSSIALARAFPSAHVDGLDADGDSIRRAREHAGTAGVGDRVTFVTGDAREPALRGGYALVTMFETLHDMAHPVPALRAARALLAPDGAVLVADEAADEGFSAPADEVQRLFYAVSVLHCLPVGRAEPDSAATGTVMRAGTLRDYARAAGFSSVDVLAIEHDVWRFYLLRP